MLLFLNLKIKQRNYWFFNYYVIIFPDNTFWAVKCLKTFIYSMHIDLKFDTDVTQSLFEWK